MLGFNREPRLPGALFVVVGAIAGSAAFDFSGHGIAVIERVTGGLPSIGLPAVRWKEIPPLLLVAASCFLMIIAQSAATARAYAAPLIARYSMKTPTSSPSRQQTWPQRSAARSS
jgi:sulfate permease, SulP family